MSGHAASCIARLTLMNKNIWESGNTQYPPKGPFPKAQPLFPCLVSGLWGWPEREGAQGQVPSIAQVLVSPLYDEALLEDLSHFGLRGDTSRWVVSGHPHWWEQMWEASLYPLGYKGRRQINKYIPIYVSWSHLNSSPLARDTHTDTQEPEQKLEKCWKY